MENTRKREIQALWQEYQGLYVVGGVLIGLLIFPFLELFINDLSQLMIGLVPEAIGIGFTVFFLDRIYQKREIEALKRRLVREAGSQSNETAKSAVDWMRHEGWLTGEDGLLKKLNMQNAKLQGAYLTDANMLNADLVEADLSDANLVGATLILSKLIDANLTNAIMFGANLSNADLTGASLKNAVLHYDVFEADLNKDSYKSSRLGNIYTKIMIEKEQIELAKRHANEKPTNSLRSKLQQRHAKYYKSLSVSVKLKGCILPDGTLWTLETDMGRFTDPEHPDFWQPEK